MQLENYYIFYKSALSPELCQKIIQYGNQKIEFKKSQGINTSAHTAGRLEKQSVKNGVPLNEKSIGNLIAEGKDVSNTYIRDSEVAWLNDKWIYDEIIPFAKKANETSGWNYDIETSEDIQFTVYNSPGGFYGWHRDGGSDCFSSYKRYIPGISPKPDSYGRIPSGYTKVLNQVGLNRKISMTINLNSEGDYEGGNLKFDWGRHAATDTQYHECVEIRPQGSIIVFPSYLYHCVTPVTSGTRYSLVMWALGRPFK